MQSRELEEAVELYRAAAKERDALVVILRDIAWLDDSGKAFNTYQAHVDHTQKHPMLRMFLET